MNSNIALTLILLALMFGAGMVSAAYGFALGREALKGVTQPDVRPVNNIAARKGGLPRREEVTLLKEEDIIANVKAQTDSGKRSTQDSGNRNKSLDRSDASSPDTKAIADKTLPITSFNRGVALEVRSVRQQGGALVMEVNLRNDSEQEVRFLYSFLNVTDNQGRVLSASTAGLPAELPPRSETFSGTISISTALLEDATKLSLSLTDYPDQRIQLQASGIPIAR